jgi:signal transduction histidine kinase
VLDALDRIAGSIAHEFKNLVGAFMGDLWFIRRHADDPDAVRRRVEEAETGAIQSGRILDQFLEAVRQPKSEGVRVNQLIADAQLVLRGAVGERHRLEMDLTARPDETRGDPAHLQAALLNLVSNARDAMPNDGTVTILTRNVVMRPEMLDERDLTPGRYIMIAVRDTGVGMDGEVLHHAFEPLFTTKESGRGTGLGLSQVRAFARNSGGTARIESAPGKGTTVRIYLPQTRSAARLSPSGEKH